MKTLLSLGLAVLLSLPCMAQNNDLPPYKKVPYFPPVKLLLADSTTVYQKDDLPKKTPVLLMYFNPKCEHCQKIAEEITASQDKFKNIHIIMATSMHFDSLQVFRDRFMPGGHRNVVMAFDPGFFLMHFFQVNRMPFIALYNEWKELIGGYDGGIPAAQILKAFGK